MEKSQPQLLSNLSAILAATTNGCIGINGGLPFKMKDDLQFFKNYTHKSNCIVGSTTLKTLPNLKGRTLITLSQNGLSVEQILDLVRKNPKEKFVVIGGAKVYEAFKPYCKRWLLTLVDTQIQGDTFFDISFLLESEGELVETIQADVQNQFDAKIYKYTFYD